MDETIMDCHEKQRAGLLAFLETRQKPGLSQKRGRLLRKCREKLTPEKLRWFCTSQRLKTCGIRRFLQMSQSQMIRSGDSLVAFFMTWSGRVFWKLTSEWVEKSWTPPRVSVGVSYQNHRPPGLFLNEIFRGNLILEPQTIFFYGCLVISNHFPCKDLEPSNWNKH